LNVDSSILASAVLPSCEAVCVIVGVYTVV
jgi:hypothetical protein